MIDTHAHVFHRGLKLANSRRYAPAYDAPLDLYLRQLDENGIANGVLVQPSFLGTDNSYLIDSLVAANGRLKGIAVVEPDTCADELVNLQDVGVVGIRLNLIGQAHGVFQVVPWSSVLTKVAALGWQVEVQAKAVDLVMIVPQLLAVGVKVVLDHFLLPDPGLGIEDPAFQTLLALADTRQVWVKISAPYRNGVNGHDTARQAFPVLSRSFGLDRLLWGSDWPHTQFESLEGMRRNLEFFETLVPNKRDRETIDAAARILFGFAGNLTPRSPT